MPQKKPFGWRPLTEEDREQYRGMSWTEEQINEFEKTNAYAPNETTVVAFHVGDAVISALAKRYGAEFVHDVCAAIESKIGRLANSEEVEDKVEAVIMQRFTEESDWDAIIRRASEERDDSDT